MKRKKTTQLKHKIEQNNTTKTVSRRTQHH